MNLVKYCMMCLLCITHHALGEPEFAVEGPLEVEYIGEFASLKNITAATFDNGDLWLAGLGGIERIRASGEVERWSFADDRPDLPVRFFRTSEGELRLVDGQFAAPWGATHEVSCYSTDGTRLWTFAPTWLPPAIDGQEITDIRPVQLGSGVARVVVSPRFSDQTVILDEDGKQVALVTTGKDRRATSEKNHVLHDGRGGVFLACIGGSALCLIDVERCTTAYTWRPPIQGAYIWEICPLAAGATPAQPAPLMVMRCITASGPNGTNQSHHYFALETDGETGFKTRPLAQTELRQFAYPSAAIHVSGKPIVVAASRANSRTRVGDLARVSVYLEFRRGPQDTLGRFACTARSVGMRGTAPIHGEVCLLPLDDDPASLLVTCGASAWKIRVEPDTSDLPP